jgi:hypothetical protein
MDVRHNSAITYESGAQIMERTELHVALVIVREPVYRAEIGPKLPSWPDYAPVQRQLGPYFKTTSPLRRSSVAYDGSDAIASLRQLPAWYRR